MNVIRNAFKHTIKIIVLIIFVCLHAIGTAWCADIKGAKDHPAAGRISGSDILVYKGMNFDSYNLPLGPAKRTEEGSHIFTNFKKIEGTVTRITYIAPDGVGPEEIIGNYRELFQKKGFETLFKAKDDDFGRYDEFVKAAGYERVFTSSGGARRFLAGRLAGQNSDVYVSVYAAENTFWGFEIKVGKTEAKKGRTYYQVDVTETKPLQNTLTVVKAEEMSLDLSKTGKVALYGILFDLDKTEIKPDSKPALDEIAKLLNQNPGLKLLVVGHTDDQGEIQYNHDLSRRRAESVVKALGANYGIAAERLFAYGVGMFAPTASNESEEGRAKNRRVELVKK
jgi:outer membrane protein OmpA-like peptidoglycan-associated protein